VTEPAILFEDHDFLVLNKPSGWLSIPAREPKPDDHVVSQWLAERAPFVVHRLDRNTSGIMLFARTEGAHKQANLWFMNRKVQKNYHFLAAPRPPAGLPSRPAVQIKTPVDGKPAQTLFEILDKGAQAFYGKATPLTGRFHQIREHALEAGFPLLGDRAYHGLSEIIDRDGVRHAIPRFMLHAHTLTLPFGVFSAGLPNDFNELKKVIL
jgi:23S rRNA-/tRNA-specific pseudouridylate synthase